MTAPLDHLAVLEVEIDRFAAALAAGPLDAPVPSCPGWTLADLGRHLGSVHRWARTASRDTADPGRQPAGPADDAAVLPWFRTGGLLDTLRAADPDRPCWTPVEPHTVAFWIRRQAHETTLHRWDAAIAAGTDTAIDPAVALDGIAEVIDVQVPRQLRRDRLTPSPDVIAVVADGVRFAVATDPAHGADPPVATVTGPADAALLLLWRRIDPTDPRLSVDGDPAALARFLARPITP